MAKKVWLLELEYNGGTERLSQGVYRQPGSQVWLDVVREVSLSDDLDGSDPLSDIEVVNSGRFDSWLQRDWLGYPVRLYVGDPHSPRSDFQQVSERINGGIIGDDGDRLRFRLHDPLAALDTPLIDQGSDQPVLFGSVFNVTAQVTDNNLGYTVHNGAVSVNAVRDRGGAVSYSQSGIPAGFRLSVMPRGVVTFDAVAPGGTPAALINRLLRNTGLSANQTSLAALPAWPLGIVARGSDSRRSVLDQLLDGLGASASVDAAGQLIVRQRLPPAARAGHQIGRASVLENGLEITAVEPPRGSITVRYNRNHTVQDAGSLNTGTDTGQGGISAADLRRYGIQWQVLSERLSASALATNVVVESPFSTTAAAQGRQAQLRTLRSVTRFIARVQCVPRAVRGVRAGDTVQITYRRYGLQAGKNVRVLAVNEKSGELEVFW